MNDLTCFADLFRKYRLRSEFETLGQFGNALADAGYIYEDSLFAHWQKGSRIPKDRELLLCMMTIFCQQKAMLTLKEANKFMASTGLGYLTDEEIEKLPIQFEDFAPFQAPKKITHFTGRTEIIELTSKLLCQQQNVLLYGQQGMGKTAIATAVAHNLREVFTDGIFWFRLDISSPVHIMKSIAEAYNKTLPVHLPLHRISDHYRSILSTKKALFIFDNAEQLEDIETLLPNSSESAVLLTSYTDYIPSTSPFQSIKVEPLSEKACIALAKKILPEIYFEEHHSSIIKLIQLVGFLPLAIQVILKQVLYNHVPLIEFVEKLEKEDLLLSTFKYDNKNLQTALAVSFNKLTSPEKKVLVSMKLFQGATISETILQKTIDLDIQVVKEILESLTAYSLIESGHRYSLHSTVKMFLKQYSVPTEQLVKAAQAYISEMKSNKTKKYHYQYISRELDSLLGILKCCIDNELLEEAAELWGFIGAYHWNVGLWQEFHKLSKDMFVLSKKLGNTEIPAQLLLRDLTRIHYYDGNMKKAESYALQAIDIALKQNNSLLIASAQERLGKTQIITGKNEGVKHLQKALVYFEKAQNKEHISHCNRYLSEMSFKDGYRNKALEQLHTSLEAIQLSTNLINKYVYTSVIFSHIGIVLLFEGKYKEAISYLQKGLEADKNASYAPGTFTWLHKLALCAACRALGYTEEKVYYNQAISQLEMLGIKKTFHLVNTYASALKTELKTYGYQI